MRNIAKQNGDICSASNRCCCFEWEHFRYWVVDGLEDRGSAITVVQEICFQCVNVYFIAMVLFFSLLESITF